jgi:putative ABC transport system permease protein
VSLLVRAGLRELARHPLQLLLAVAGVALGVAVGVAVDLASESARRAFRLSTEATAGRATHAVTAGSAGIDEAIFARIRGELGLRASAPVVEGELRLPPGGAVPRLRLLGVDPLSEVPFRSFLAPGLAVGGGLERLLVEPGAVALARDTAREMGVAPGDRFRARAGARELELRLAAVVEPGDEGTRRAFAGLALADIATAQELLDRPGRLDRIELVLPEGEKGETAAVRLAALLPADARLAPIGARAGALEQLTRAFRFNLRALSGLALVCGAFLVFNTATFAAVRRRELFARLRAAGVDGRTLVFALAAEAVLLGAVGSLIGLAAGVALGRVLVAQVLATIDDLYFRLTVRAFEVDPGSLWIGLALGVGTTLAATLPPALEASRAPLRVALAGSTLEARAATLAQRGALAGGALAAAGGALLVLPGLEIALAAFLLVVLGAALAVPLALSRGAAVTARGGGLLARLAARGVARSLARTGPAAAALAVAVAVSLAVALTVASFRRAVVDWLEATLAGDLYVSAPAGPGGPSAALPPELAARLGAIGGVRRVQTLRAAQLPADADGFAVALLGVETDGEALASLTLRAGAREAAERELAAGRAAWISEPLAERRGLAVGDVVRLATPGGELALPVAAVYVDYGSERGAIAVAAETFARRFPDPRLAALSLRLTAGADADAVALEVARVAAPLELVVQSSRELKRHSLAIFDRTFRVTGVLRALALLVAALGIAAALAALELERARHFALLRALGLSRSGVARVVVGECAALGLAAGVAALPIGAGLAALLVTVVQRRSFGWTFPLELPWRPFAETVALAVVAAVAAGALAAARVARRPPVAALRDE